MKTFLPTSEACCRRGEFPFAMLVTTLAARQWADEEIIPLLHQHPGATFFTSDRDFFHRDLCHSRYCLVCLFVSRSQTAVYVRRVLRHPNLRTQAERSGKVIGVRPERLHVWTLHAREKVAVEWSE